MKKLILSFLSIVLLIAFTSWGFVQGAGCEKDYKELVAALYASAMTHPDDFLNRVYKDREFYTNNNQLSSCFEQLATALKMGALAGPSVNDIKEKAYDISNKAGAPEMGDGLYKQMLETKSDMLILARHLNSLSDSIQEICNGNFSAYHNSEVYQLSTFTWNAMEYAWSHRPGAVDMFRKMFWNMYKWYVRQLAQAI
jgi:hypothetical protein